MAVFSAYQTINMNQIYTWTGDIPIHNQNQIRVTDGYRTQDYFGSFQYDDYGDLSGGYTTSTAAYQNGAYFTISDFNFNALTMESYISSGNISAAMSLSMSGNDTVNGSTGNDVISGFAGNNHLYGNDGNDTLISSGGSNSFDGGQGLDVLSYNFSSKNLTISQSSTGYIVSNNQGSIDTLTNMERISFGDGSVLAIDVRLGENTGSTYRLYQAALDRTPDKSGLAFWVSQKDAGVSLSQIALGFTESPEFKSLNPTNDQNSLIKNFYFNVLHRQPDQEGLAFWEQQMASGMKTNDVLVSFSESAENIQNTAYALSAGIWLV
jgi:serralysin